MNFPACTLPETNSSPLKIGRNPKGNSSSNHPFSGAMRPFQGGYVEHPTISIAKLLVLLGNFNPIFYLKMVGIDVLWGMVYNP